MNERIRELWEFILVEHNFDRDVKYYEEFAKLIIKECVEVAHKYDEPKLSGPGLMIGNMIEEHFGVEE